MSELPVTGDSAVDEALASVADLDDVPVSEHHDRLVRAHAALHDALHGGREPAAPAGSARTGPPVPGPRPS